MPLLSVELEEGVLGTLWFLGHHTHFLLCSTLLSILSSLLQYTLSFFRTHPLCDRRRCSFQCK